MEYVRKLQSSSQIYYLCLMHLDRSITVAFTGHRTYCGEAGVALAAALRELQSAGFRTFLSGMAVGFDLAAAQQVLALRAEYSDVRLVCVVPFVGQEQRFSAADRDLYHDILTQADEVIYVCQNYLPECYSLRNNLLVDQSSFLVAWYDGSTGGTHYTVRRALARGREVRNLHPSARNLACSEPTLF